ncbi:MAG: SGNH/GDSL hydrolase family protein [Rhizomicrobium sp.]
MRGIRAVIALAAVGVVAAAAAAPPAPRWVGSWSAAQQLPEPANQLPDAALQGGLLRQVVHLSAGGGMIRVRISNAYGTAPLHLAEVHVARPLPGTPGAIVDGSDRLLRFSGNAEVTVPAGADYVSDPLDVPVAPLSDLAVTLRYASLAGQPTGHPGSRATSFLASDGDAAVPLLSQAVALAHWYMLAGVEVSGPALRGTVVAFGDSITDGRGSVPDANNRWPDDLARRLQAAPASRGIGVLNMGIGGNRLLLDGLGPNGLARFDRDVLAQPGVRWLILLEGINDLGVLTRDAPVSPAEHEALVARLVAAYRQIALRAHAHGIAVMAGTLLPWLGFTYYHPDALNEADRQALNAWIRTPGNFDAVVDFDRVLRDPAAPGRLLPQFESGDHLHPSPAGYQAMADAIPLAFFAQPRKARRR